MFFIILSVIELIAIIVLSYCIKEYYIERDSLKASIIKLQQDMGYRMSAHIEILLKKANNIRHKLPTELYLKSIKKNPIVKETSQKFYEELVKGYKSTQS